MTPSRIKLDVPIALVGFAKFASGEENQLSIFYDRWSLVKVCLWVSMYNMTQKICSKKLHTAPKNHGELFFLTTCPRGEDIDNVTDTAKAQSGKCHANYTNFMPRTLSDSPGKLQLHHKAAKYAVSYMIPFFE